MKFPKLEVSQHISSYCVACLWPSLLQSFIQTSDPSGTIHIGEESTTLSRRDIFTSSYNFNYSELIIIINIILVYNQCLVNVERVNVSKELL